MSVLVLGLQPAGPRGQALGLGMRGYSGLKEYLESEHPRLAVGLLRGMGAAQASLIADALASDLVEGRFDAYLEQFDQKRFRLNAPRECQACEGTGFTEDMADRCTDCRGVGMVRPMSGRALDQLSRADAEAFAEFLRLCGGFTVDF